MAYKKYFYKNGKKFGPYYYQSYRDETGKVKKRYVGTVDPDRKLVTPTKILVFIIVSCLVLILFMFNNMDLFLKSKMTGRVVDIRELESPEKAIAEKIAEKELKSNVDVSKIVDLELKNQNKLMEFNIKGDIVHLNFNLLNYSEWVKTEGEENVSVDNFNIDVQTSKERYKWGYNVKLNDLNFMAKIDVTSNQTIIIIDNQTLKIGKGYISFADLASQGYIVSIEQPVIISEINISSNLTEVNITEINISEENITEINITSNIANITQVNITINMTNISENPVINMTNITETTENLTNITLPENNVTEEIIINDTSDTLVNETGVTNIVNEDEVTNIVNETHVDESQNIVEQPVAEPPEAEQPIIQLPEAIINVVKVITGFMIRSYSGITGFFVNLGRSENIVSVYVQKDFTNSSYNVGDIINLDPELIFIESTDVSACSILNSANEIYNLTGNIGSGGNCFNVTADNITINGNGYTITGDMNISNATGRAFTNLTINNTIIIGNILAVGGNNGVDTGYDGGNVTLTNSNVSGIIDIHGGNYGNSNPSGNGGTITLTNSNASLIDANSGTGYGSSGGNVVLINSGVTIINTTGAEGDVSSGGWGGNGGNVTLINSTAGIINTYGVDVTYGVGDGTGGNVTLINSIATTINSQGGLGRGIKSGGLGGTITLTNSNVTSINSSGGNMVAGGNGDAGNGGNVIITNSDVKIINLYGGTSGGASGDAGNGGNVTLINSLLNLTNLVINISKGIGAVNSADGKLNLTSSGFYNNFGNIKFFSVYANVSFVSAILNISNDLAYVNSANYIDYNQSANITLMGIPTNLTNATIIRDGKFNCNTTSNPPCFNFTSLNAGNVTFNVSSWTNYSIGELDTVYPIFYFYWDNTGITVGGIALFNVSVNDTNGSVVLYINGANYTARNLTSNVYNVSVSGLSAGTYSYTWGAYGNGTLKNLNISNSRSYGVNSAGSTTPPGGGGGGGTTHQNETVITNCTYDWVCGEWDECINEIQIRNCINQGTCTGDSGKPVEQQNCYSSNDTVLTTDIINSLETPWQKENVIDRVLGAGNEEVTWICGNWSDCKEVYGLRDIINKNIFFNGEQIRECKSNDGDYKRIERRNCKVLFEISVKPVEKCYRNFLEVYDLNQTLVSRMELVNDVNRKLNIQFELVNESSCS